MEGKHFKRDCKLVILNIFYTISFPFVRKDQAVIGTNILIDLQAYTCISGFVYVVTHLKIKDYLWTPWKVILDLSLFFTQRVYLDVLVFQGSNSFVMVSIVSFFLRYNFKPSFSA